MLARLASASPALVGTAILMIPVLIVSLVGLAVDDRLITGAPAWLKPAKFATSIAIYTATLAWVFTYLPDWPRLRRTVGRFTALVMVVEMAIIGIQAWRGTSSHFNVSTPLDGALFTFMGAAIVSQTLISVFVAVALWRQTFHDVALGWALRLGMTLTVVGALSGGLMTRPTAAQLESARSGAPLVQVGAHTVGAPDGGPGMTGTGWSRDHGDLRVPHFIGLHALQVLPILALMLRRRLTDDARARVVAVAAASYATLYVVLLVAALRGVPFGAPDAVTVLQLIAWVTVSGGALALVTMRRVAARASQVPCL